MRKAPFPIFLFASLWLCTAASSHAYTNAFQYSFGNSWEIDGHGGLERISYDYPDGWLSIIATYGRNSCCYAAQRPFVRAFDKDGLEVANLAFGADTPRYPLFSMGGATDWFTVRYDFSSTTIVETVYPRNRESEKDVVIVAQGLDLKPDATVSIDNGAAPSEREVSAKSLSFISLAPAPIATATRCSTRCCR